MPRQKKSQDKKEEDESGSSEGIIRGVDKGEALIFDNEIKLEKLDLASLKKDDKKIGEVIENLSKEGLTKAKIGLVLRDSYGIPKSKFLGKKLGRILVERKISSGLPEDLLDLVNNSNKLKKHLEKNKQDKSAKRGLQLAEAKIKKLSNYYKKRAVIPGNWER